MQSYISAIKTVLENAGIKISEDRCLLSSLARACRVVNDKVRTRLPIQKSLLTMLIAKTQEKFASQPYLSALFLAMFSTAYFGLFRVGELTKSEHVVKALDVHIGVNKQKILFVLRSSKTHGRYMLPQKIKICSTKLKSEPVASLMKGRMFCPYDLLQKYLKLCPQCKTLNEQFFVYTDSSPVNPGQFRSCLKAVLRHLGFDAKLYSSHSFRISRGCNLIKYGLSVETIKHLGRWKSNVVFTYLKNA